MKSKYLIQRIQSKKIDFTTRNIKCHGFKLFDFYDFYW